MLEIGGFLQKNGINRREIALPRWLSLVFAKETIVDICAKYTHYSDVAIVAIMALVAPQITELWGETKPFDTNS